MTATEQMGGYTVPFRYIKTPTEFYERLEDRIFTDSGVAELFDIDIEQIAQDSIDDIKSIVGEDIDWLDDELATE